MNDNILNEVNRNGIFINDQLLNNLDKNNLKKDFENKKDYEFFQIKDDEEIKKISNTLFNFLNRDYINKFLVDYLGNGTKCTHLLFTRTKTRIKKKIVSISKVEVFLVSTTTILANKLKLISF